MTGLPPPTLPEAGWFPDPWTIGRLRYWDGQAWTPWVAPGEPERPTATTFPLSTGLIGLAMLFGGIAVGIVVAAVLLVLQVPEALVVLLAGLAAYVPVVWWCQSVSRRLGTGDLGEDLGLRFQWIDLALGLATWFAAVVLQVLVTLLLAALGLPLESNTQSLSDAQDEPGVFVAFTILAVLVAPVVEELFFRGLLLRAFRSRWVPWLAVLAQGAVFGVVHVQVGVGLANVVIVMALATVGITFGFVVDKVGRLGPSIVAHGLLNIVAVLAVLATT